MTPSASSSAASPSRKPVAVWLFVVAGLVAAMVVLGGITRLTGSGLSIARWAPVSGTLPPLDRGDWQELYAEYQRTPQFQTVNAHLDLAGFQEIFWLEYLHRLLGRVLGVVFFVPFVVFLARRRLGRDLAAGLAAVAVLGALQGGLGWYMVKSGLVDVPRVSPYRLAAHLLLAIALFGTLVWLGLGLWSGRRGPAAGRGLRAATVAGLGLVVLTAVAGAFVAGIKAGVGFASYPLMNGEWIPSGYGLLQPAWRNLFENPVAVQFNHRWMATALVVLEVGLWAWSLRWPLTRRLRFTFHALAATALAQGTLGVLTVLLSVPISLAWAHQALGLALFTVHLVLVHGLVRGGNAEERRVVVREAVG